MKLHRFIGNFDLQKQEIEIKDNKIIKQIKDVLELKVDDLVILGDGRGQSAKVRLDKIYQEKITGQVLEVHTEKEIAKKVHLYLAILKKENFELAAQKAVECGVSSITPIITERTIKTGLNLPRLEKIILEGSQQCGQNLTPTISPILNFEDTLKKAEGEKIIFHPGAKEYIPDPEKNGAGKNAKNVSIFIGPEGGLTEREIELAKDCGFSVASLGSLILTGVTAALVATYRAVHGI